MSQPFRFHADPPSAAARPRTALTQATRFQVLSRAGERPLTTQRGDTRTVVTSDADGAWIAAVLEGRKGLNREIGLALVNTECGHVKLLQFHDSQTYVKVTYALQQHSPTAILLPQATLNARAKLDSSSISDKASTSGERFSVETHGDAVLINCLEEAFEDATLVPIVRKYWDADGGLAGISRYIIDDDKKGAYLSACQGKYFALAATAALFSYLELKANLLLHVSSVKIEYVALEGTMVIDQETVQHLELLHNTAQSRSKESLFGFLSAGCSTVMGQRLLRGSILQPSTSAATLDARLDAVQELTDNGTLYQSCFKALKALKSVDCDKLIGSLIVSVPQAVKLANAKMARPQPSKEAERKIINVLQLRQVLRALPALCSVLRSASSSLLSAVALALKDERHHALLDRIDETINDEAVGQIEKGGLSAKNSRVYAIRAGPDDAFLEVARATYAESIEDVAELCRTTADHLQLPSLVPSFQSHGFIFSCARAEWDDQTKAGPAGPISKVLNVTKRAKKVSFSTMELAKKNMRIQQSLEEIFMLSDELLDALIDDIRSHIACLYRSTEAVSLVDMLCAFSKVATSQGYTRPEFSGALAIKSGRHALIERFQKREQAFVPNDAFADRANAFQVITGANFSGKSTYIRQIALIVILAQMGCYVPAEYASVPIYDAMFSRLSNDDLLDQGLSHFAREMQTMGNILSSIKLFKQPFLFVDELGRATSPLEGLGIAQAISEEIIRSGAVCFFATHFLNLAKTLFYKPNVVALNLHANVHQERTECRLVFTHKIADGVTSLVHYGLELAKAVAFPVDLLERAKAVALELDHIQLQQRDLTNNKLFKRRKIVTRVRDRAGGGEVVDMDQLVAMLQDYRDHATISDAELAALLAEKQEEVLTALIETFDVEPVGSASGHL